MCALLSLAIPVAFAEETDEKPVILSAVPDSATTPGQLTISGKHLGSARPLVTLDARTLSVSTFTATRVTAALPAGLAPGTYLLTLEPNGRAETVAKFDVALGAIGPKGDEGDTGPTGSTGPAGATGPQGVAGPQGPSGPPGTPGTGGSDIFSVTAPSMGLRILPKEVAALAVPAGQYWIVFTSTLTNTTQNVLNPTDTIACAIAGISAQNSVRLLPDANQAVMSLQAVAAFPAPTTISVRCSGFNLQFSGLSDNNVLTALKVGAIH